MKSITLLPLLMVLIALGCKKQDNTKDSTTIDSDTSQYLSWNITGDTFNNETFLLHNDSFHTIYGDYTADETEIGFYNVYPSNAGNSYSVAVGIRFMGKVARVYPIDYFNYVLLDLEGLNIYSKSGQITITHFAKNTNEYFSGTFSGEFEVRSNSSKKYIVKDGKFRIKRMY